MSTIIHRKEKIIYTAIDVINELGVQALSTKKLAQMEKIAESTIFKHFKSKTEILSGVIDFYSQYDDDIFESISLKKYRGIDALKFYLDSYIRYYENYPAITAITQGLDEMRYTEALSDKVVKITNNRRQCVMDIIQDAQDLQEVSSEFDVNAYVDAIMGSINGIIRRWRMENYTFDLYERCYVAIALIVKTKKIQERGDNSVNKL